MSRFVLWDYCKIKAIVLMYVSDGQTERESLSSTAIGAAKKENSVTDLLTVQE